MIYRWFTMILHCHVYLPEGIYLIFFWSPPCPGRSIVYFVALPSKKFYMAAKNRPHIDLPVDLPVKHGDFP